MFRLFLRRRYLWKSPQVQLEELDPGYRCGVDVNQMPILFLPVLKADKTEGFDQRGCSLVNRLVGRYNVERWD